MKIMPCQTENLKHMMSLEGSKKAQKTTKTQLREKFGEELSNASTKPASQISLMLKMRWGYRKLGARQIWLVVAVSHLRWQWEGPQATSQGSAIWTSLRISFKALKNLIQSNNIEHKLIQLTSSAHCLLYLIKSINTHHSHQIWKRTQRMQMKLQT